MPTVEITHPVTREKIEEHADALFPDTDSDAQEAAVTSLLRSAQAHESWISTRDPIEQVRLLSQPVAVSPDPDSDDSDSGDAPAAARRPARRKR